MTDAETVELIFAPGFSTAAAVTDVSGRGVGMDVVRSAIARMGGQVTVTSQLTRGTNVRFMLPFTVMMLRVVTVDAGGQMFGIPIDAVIETAQMPRDRISRLGAAEAIVLRERTVPLVRLSETLDLPRRCENPCDGPCDGPCDRPCDPGAADARIVVVTVAGQTGAIEVDGFGERMDVMLKPMEGLLAGTSGVAGTTLLGDGRVLILLDLQELLR
jgi:two-component system chemotaxis sensor kinase CheA